MELVTRLVEHSNGHKQLYYRKGCSFSFADGRAELHHWHDLRTTPPLGSINIDGSTSSPRNQDIAWLQDHATRPK